MKANARSDAFFTQAGNERSVMPRQAFDALAQAQRVIPSNGPDG